MGPQNLPAAEETNHSWLFIVQVHNHTNTYRAEFPKAFFAPRLLGVIGNG
jgi:hypothetical protein